MTKWVRKPGKEEKVKIGFSMVLSRSMDTDLVNFIESIPYGETTKTIKEILTKAAKSKAAKQQVLQATSDDLPATSETDMSVPMSEQSGNGY
jgi:phage tail protein X